MPGRWPAVSCMLNHNILLVQGTRVLVIGAGPCGLRTAIEAQLLGAKVVVVEKRDRYSRNNVLHLWPCNIHELRALGAKKFYGKFCAGSIDHISIRQLQCILLKAGRHNILGCDCSAAALAAYVSVCAPGVSVAGGGGVRGCWVRRVGGAGRQRDWLAGAGLSSRPPGQ